MNRGMLSDAIATSIGAVCGTSTVTTFSEINAGSWVITLLFIAMLLLTH